MLLSLYSSNSYLCTLLLQPQNFSPNATSNASRFRTFCCSDHTIQVNATKTKRKPRPSFYEQIRHKWSLKLPSTREKFPWQEQEQHEQVADEEEEELEEEEEEEIEKSETSGVVLSEPEIDASPSVSFTSPNRLITAPWIHRTRPQNLHFDSQREKEDNVGGSFGNREDYFADAVVDEGERIEKEVNCKKDVKFDDNLDKLRRDKETTVIKYLNDVVCGNEKTFEGSRVFENIEIPSDGDGGKVELPWVGEIGLESRKRGNAELAERMLPEHELKRLRNMSLRMLERIKVGPSGITQELVDAIHEKWRRDEVVKLKFDEPLSCNMKRTHEILENRTGGLVIWRSGSSLVLYRGITYKLPCVQSYIKKNEVGMVVLPSTGEAESDGVSNGAVKDLIRMRESFIPNAAKYLKNLSQEELMDFSELNHLLDELGPRFRDWCGCEPLPVDADLLPFVVPGYKPPFRLLLYGVRPCLTNREMTIFRRLARTMPPHFALGRSRELQGLAKVMVKLWERSAIAKIAIKRGVLNTRNERMAEELKRMTGGTLLSRNKEYIVFYRGNDFLPPAVTEKLEERWKRTHLQQEKEEQARQMALAFTKSNAQSAKVQLVAGTLSETMAATSHWGSEPSSENVEKMMRDSALARQVSLVKHFQNRLALAKLKLRKAEKALAKVAEHLEPAELPTDLETISDEERFLFRKMGLSMKPYLFLGRREVFDGTIQNMHLHWKYRELVKIIVKRKSFAQVKHFAISLEAESGGVLVSVDRTTKGYAIIVYRGKNYQRPLALKPANLLTRRQALARSIELQRCEALKHHISDLQERIELLKSELEEMKAGKKTDVQKNSYSKFDDVSLSDDDSEEYEEEEAYLEAYDSSDEDAYDTTRTYL